MSSDRAILLISDRPDRSQVLARRFGGLCTCRTKGLYEQESTAELVTAVVTDVRFRHPSDIANRRHPSGQQLPATRATLLHDLDKARIPLAILNKSRALTREEAAIMRTHARIGYELPRQQGDYELELLEGNGSVTATSTGAKCRMLRDRIVSSCRRAVAAMAISAKLGE